MDKRKVMRRVTVETDRTVIFRSRETARPLWCADCNEEVEMVSVETAGREVGIGELGMWQQLESGAVHFTEAAGRVFVCLRSLRTFTNMELKGEQS